MSRWSRPRRLAAVWLFTSGCLAMAVAVRGQIAAASGPVPIPETIRAILVERCLDCHSGASPAADVDLDHSIINFADPESRELWERVAGVLDEGRMPPPEEPRLPVAAGKALWTFVDGQLCDHITIGGTPPRRLSRDEYLRTVRTLFGLSSFKLPAGFPSDSVGHGFDNQAAALAVSPAHIEAYRETARLVADELFPPPRPPLLARRWEAGPKDMVLSFSAATVHGDALRLVSRSVDVMRSCTWPSRIEIKDSGRYAVEVSASQFTSAAGHAFADPMLLEVYARPVTATDRSKVSAFRLLQTLEVAGDFPESFSFEADLYEGETLLFRWANAEMTHEFDELADQMAGWFASDKRFLAAWQQAVFPSGKVGRPETTRLRGRNGWDIVSRHWADPTLDLAEATLDSEKSKALLARFRSLDGTFNLADALCHFYHERGPALELHRVTVAGPSQFIESPADRRRVTLRQRLTGSGTAWETPEAVARSMLTTLLPRAFRRPVDDATVDQFMAIASDHWAEGHSLDEGLHLLVRNILVSPRLLYRGLGPVDSAGRLDQFDLASRLSYFLTQGPPDATLVDLATRSRLAEGWVLQRETNRLLPKRMNDPLITSFVGQWLGTRTLAGIMPDPKFRFDEADVRLAKQETERFVTEMLTKNLPMETFIDPGFTFSTPAFVQRNYGLTPPEVSNADPPLTEAQRKQFQRLTIPQGDRFGGLLGQAAILMATANGVDTQPVIRGVWVLENILGTPAPPPPKNVPALTPETQGATTPRELLAAHTREASCAVCHRRIDPLGFVLENYDPVGRWRKTWPDSKVEVDAAGVLPDGTAVAGPTEFKAWLVANIDRFSRCVAEKLLSYATGRQLNYAERREVADIVATNRQAGNGFRDLVMALVVSETFRAK